MKYFQYHFLFEINQKTFNGIFGKLGFQMFWSILNLIWFGPQFWSINIKSRLIWIMIFRQNSVIQAILFWVALESEKCTPYSKHHYTWLKCLIYLLDLKQCQDILGDFYSTNAWGKKPAKNLFMSFCTIFWYVILGWYHNNLLMKIKLKQTSYWSKFLKQVFFSVKKVNYIFIPK